jgi:uncharacterized membrane protein/heat shock protein HslJ
MRRQPSRSALFFAALAVSGTASCSGPGGGSGSTPSPATDAGLALSDLGSDPWLLSELGRGERVPAEVRIDAAFEEGRISGSAGCNRYFANIESPTPGALRIGPIGATRRMCEPPVMELEDRYLAALSAVTRGSLSGGQLELLFEGAQGADALVFVREAPSGAGGPGDGGDRAEGERFRGHLILGHEVRSFTACGSSRERWVVDRTGGDLRNTYRALTTEPYQKLYVELRASAAPTLSEGFGADYDGALEVFDLRFAAAETRGCAEDLAGLDFDAYGNEPLWRLEIAPDALRLRRLGAPELRFPHGPVAATGVTRSWASRGADDASIEVRLEEQRCIDSMSGAHFAFRARVRLGEQSWLGCAREGGA